MLKEILFPLFIFFIIFKCQAKYDPTIALRMIQYSDAVYCGDKTHGGLEPMLNWTCEPCKNLNGFKINSASFLAGGRQTFALTGIEAAPEPAIIVAFRGSVLPLNFLDDVDDKLVNWWTPGQVHEGFLRSYEGIRSKVFAQVQNLTIQCKGCPIYITGHSLGASQSTLAAIDLASNFTKSQFYLYNFGCLRVGTKEFIKFYNQTSNLETWRVTHRYDAAPQGVDRSKGYHHTSTEVYYPKNTSLEYRICDGSGEDPSCEDSVPESKLNMNDHNLYLGHSMWCCRGEDRSQCSFPFPDLPAYIYDLAIGNIEMINGKKIKMHEKKRRRIKNANQMKKMNRKSFQKKKKKNEQKIKNNIY